MCLDYFTNPPMGSLTGTTVRESSNTCLNEKNNLSSFGRTSVPAFNPDLL